VAKPRIGVTASTGNPAEAYVTALRESGAEPIILENKVTQLESDLDGIDGVLISGGYDVDPARYREAAHATTEIADADREAYEFALIVRARERNIPTLAICRGTQVANVAFGGSLIQHVPDVVGMRVPHERKRSDGTGVKGVIAEHIVTVEPNTRLAAILGTTELATSARHHQSLGHISGDLRVVARTSDGIVEAVEPRWPARFWVGVQWHPESTIDEDGGTSRALFAAFVAACATSGARPVSQA
jgi:putative glutamine amidotransferase